MRARRWIPAGVLALAVMAGGAALAAGPRWGRGGGWCGNQGYGRIYDPETEETVTGKIEKVEFMRPEEGMSRGMHLVVRVEKRPLKVHLGPAWYLEKQELPLEEGDRVTILGSRVEFGEERVLIARTLTKGGDVLELRDETGRPYWAGWRRRMVP